MEVWILDGKEYVCDQCGAEHDTEIEAIQCGCGYD
jgi:DNA-directed RNA polymerase subunit RPC12/RpoP